MDEALAQGVWITGPVSAVWAGARRGAAEHLPRGDGGVVAQGVRAHRWRHQGCRRQGACDVEMSAPATCADLELSNAL